MIHQFTTRPIPETLPREFALPTDTNKVVGLAGVRRSGKTFHFFDTIRRLTAQGVERRQVIYLNFEDDRLQPLAAEDLDMVLRVHREMFPEMAGKRCYLFIDEVQNVPGWERWVRRLHDTEDVRLFVTGSSSQVLQRDLSSALRGRSVTFEVFPLSFGEFLDFRGIPRRVESADAESLVRSAFAEYLRWGGFPEIVLADEAMRPLILGEYASLMLYRDLLERHQVRNELLMRELLRFAFRNTASLVNVSKLHRDFRSLGFSVSKNTLYEYLEYLQDGFLIFLLPKRERSLRKQAHNPKKLHIIDPGLVAAFIGNPDRDVGRKLETTVFLELRRQQQRVYYYQDRDSEVDLCSEDGDRFWNCCWSLKDPATHARETKAMALGSSLSEHSLGFLLYHEFSSAGRMSMPDAMPAWKWLLESGG